MANLWCDSCLQNHEHCNCPPIEVAPKLVVSEWSKKAAYQLQDAPVELTLLDGISEPLKPSTEKVWDGYMLKNFAGIGLEDPTRLVIIKEFPRV